jgi:stage IV sporulation protein FB
MRWGRVEVTGGFLLLLAWLNYCDTQMLFPMAMGAAIIHEAGHWAAIRAVSGRIRLLRLSVVGAEMQVEGTLSYMQELVCALAGPAVNLITARFAAKAGWEAFAGLNLALGVFNLLPIGVLDGGRIFNCMSAMALGPDVGNRLSRGVDSLLALVLLLGGTALVFFGGSVTLLLVAVWILSRNKEWIILKNI